MLRSVASERRGRYTDGAYHPFDGSQESHRAANWPIEAVLLSGAKPPRVSASGRAGRTRPVLGRSTPDASVFVAGAKAAAVFCRGARGAYSACPGPIYPGCERLAPRPNPPYDLSL